MPVLPSCFLRRSTHAPAPKDDRRAEATITMPAIAPGERELGEAALVAGAVEELEVEVEA